MTPWTTECPDQTYWQRYIEAHSKPCENGCMEWQRRLNRYGYGRVRWVAKDGSRHQTSAHRMAYLAYVGPAPTGMVPDHLCRNRACVNVEHLELVTVGENVRRGEVGRWQRVGATGTAYPCGHPRSRENSVTAHLRTDGSMSKQCRTCNRARARVWAAARRSA